MHISISNQIYMLLFLFLILNPLCFDLIIIVVWKIQYVFISIVMGTYLVLAIVFQNELVKDTE